MKTQIVLAHPLLQDRDGALCNSRIRYYLNHK